MKIKETIERECCQRTDLKPIEGTPKAGHIPRYVFCVHCGAHREMHSYSDAAGGSDWEYQKMPAPWVKKDIVIKDSLIMMENIKRD